jgi:hypothetical protein
MRFNEQIFKTRKYIHAPKLTIKKALQKVTLLNIDERPVYASSAS